MNPITTKNTNINRIDCKNEFYNELNVNGDCSEFLGIPLKLTDDAEKKNLAYSIYTISILKHVATTTNIQDEDIKSYLFREFDIPYKVGAKLIALCHHQSGSNTYFFGGRTRMPRTILNIFENLVGNDWKNERNIAKTKLNSIILEMRYTRNAIENIRTIINKDVANAKPLQNDTSTKYVGVNEGDTYGFTPKMIHERRGSIPGYRYLSNKKVNSNGELKIFNPVEQMEDNFRNYKFDYIGNDQVNIFVDDYNVDTKKPLNNYHVYFYSKQSFDNSGHNMLHATSIPFNPNNDNAKDSKDYFDGSRKFAIYATTRDETYVSSDNFDKTTSKINNISLNPEIFKSAYSIVEAIYHEIFGENLDFRQGGLNCGVFVKHVLDAYQKIEHLFCK